MSHHFNWMRQTSNLINPNNIMFKNALLCPLYILTLQMFLTKKEDYKKTIPYHEHTLI